MIDTFLLEHENAAQCAEMHASAIAENSKQEIVCRFTGRKLGEIGLKPRGFGHESLPDLPDFDAEKEISGAIGEDTRDALRTLQLCGRGIVRSSSIIWEGDDD